MKRDHDGSIFSVSLDNQFRVSGVLANPLISSLPGTSSFETIPFSFSTFPFFRLDFHPFLSSRLLSMRNFERQANRIVANRSKQREEEGTRREKRRSNKRGESDRSNHRQI